MMYIHCCSLLHMHSEDFFHTKVGPICSNAVKLLVGKHWKKFRRFSIRGGLWLQDQVSLSFPYFGMFLPVLLFVVSICPPHMGTAFVTHLKNLPINAEINYIFLLFKKKNSFL